MLHPALWVSTPRLQQAASPPSRDSPNRGSLGPQQVSSCLTSSGYQHTLESVQQDDRMLLKKEIQSAPGQPRLLSKSFIALQQLQTTNIVSDDDDDADWPQGYRRRELLLIQGQSSAKKWNHTKWVWRSQGEGRHRGVQVGIRVCLGVLQCLNCKWLVRPMTNKDSRILQVERGCQNSTCPSSNPLYHFDECKARTYHWSTTRNGDEFLVWEHHGEHEHQRPPNVDRSKRAATSVNEHVQRPIETSASKSQASDAHHDSATFPDISASHGNPYSSSRQVNFAQANLGLAPIGSLKAGLSVLAALSPLEVELEESFLIDSSLHGPVYLVFQTAFMRRLLHSSVEDWNVDSVNRHGMVTDSDFTYFGDGALNVTCIYNNILAAWLPVLYTWALGSDVAHYRPHFRHISQSIVRYILSSGGRLKFNAKYLLHMMDLSSPRRSAHAEEYADAVILTKDFFHFLSPDAKEVERDTLLKEAQKTDGGFESQFHQSGNCLVHNDSLIPPDKAVDFLRLLRTMTEKSTAFVGFTDTVITIQRTFPRTSSWLSWWMRPPIASLTFPAQSSVGLKVSAKTTSPAFATDLSGSPLNLAVGKGHDLKNGIKNLFSHVKELETEYNNRCFELRAVREGRPPREKKRDNETQELASEEKPPLTEIRHFGSANGLHLRGYESQSSNSSFFDNGHELWFRAFALWKPDIQARFLAIVPKSSYLGSLAYHFDTRLRMSHSPKTTESDYARLLSLRQRIALGYFSRWNFNENLSALDRSKLWLSHAVADTLKSREVMGYFGVDHQASWECPNGHCEKLYATAGPQVVYNLHTHQVQIACLKERKWSITLDEYFGCLVPRVSSPESTALHLLNEKPCSSTGCSVKAFMSHITTFWPRVLNICPNSAAELEQNGLFRQTFSIRSSSESGIVSYVLVGRVVLENGHLTSQLRIRDENYIYDGTKNGGKLTKSPNAGLLQESDDGAVYYVYHRTSQASETSRRITDISRDYDSVPVTDPGFKNEAHSPRAEFPEDDDDIYLPDIPTDFNCSEVIQTDGIIACQTEPATSEVSLPGSNIVFGQYEQPAFEVCGETCYGRPGVDVLALLTCSLCEREWHEACVEATFEDEFCPGLDQVWSCPACIGVINGLWDQLMIGQYIAIRPSPTSRFFAAKILGRSSPQDVHLEWYPGNVYRREETPIAPITHSSPNACLLAYQNDDHFMKEFGAIKWPLQLKGDALDFHGYKNPLVENALKQASHNVKETISGRRQHPLLDVYRRWKSGLLDRLKAAQLASRASGGRQAPRHLWNVQMELEFKGMFNLDILPGDASLVEPYVSEIYSELYPQNLSWSPHIILLTTILFELVIVRVYLGQLPSSDPQIFWLSLRLPEDEIHKLRQDDVHAEAKKGSLDRQLTLPERVMLACFTASQVRQGSAPLSKASIRPLKLMNALTSQFTLIPDTSHIYCDLPLTKAVNCEGKEQDFFTAGRALIGADLPSSVRLFDDELSKDPTAHQILSGDCTPRQVNDPRPDLSAQPTARTTKSRKKRGWAEVPVDGLRRSKRRKTQCTDGQFK